MMDRIFHIPVIDEIIMFHVVGGSLFSIATCLHIASFNFKLFIILI